MFLPVLLIRDYGTLGFMVFAVPNVIGAGAMGWTLRGEGVSGRMVGAHRRAMELFSRVTFAFQAFFLLSLASLVFGRSTAHAISYWPFVMVVAAIGLMTAFERARGKRGELTGLLLWIFSIAMAIVAFESRVLDTSMLTTFTAPGNFPDTIWLALSCTFGFALCPYLDLTFHKAWQDSGAKRRATFGIGFGFFFLLMIVFTALYAGSLLTGVVSGVMTVAMLPVLLHIAGQLVYTMGLHSKAFNRKLFSKEDPSSSGMKPVNGGFAGIIFVLLVGVVAVVGAVEDKAAGFEFVYRLFMSFYGLVFPAYVLICMIPTWRNPLPPTRRQVLAWLASVVVASPMMYMAFIEKRMWWVGPALAVVFVASRVRAGYRAPQAVASLMDVEARASGRDSADPSGVEARGEHFPGAAPPAIDDDPSGVKRQ